MREVLHGSIPTLQSMLNGNDDRAKVAFRILAIAADEDALSALEKIVQGDSAGKYKAIDILLATSINSQASEFLRASCLAIVASSENNFASSLKINGKEGIGWI